MNPESLKSEIKSIQSNLDINNSSNRINQSLNEIQNAVVNEVEREDPSDERRKRTLTNQEIADSDYPIDGSKNTYTQIPKSAIEKLSQEMKNIRNDLERLSNEVSKSGTNGMSNSYDQLQEQIYGLKDDFDFSLFEHGEPRIVQVCKKINTKNDVDDADIDTISEETDRIVKQIKYLNRNLRSIDVPSEEKVREEIRETEAKRAEREYEEMKPHMNMKRLVEAFNKGEEFTAQDLADEVEVWSLETAESAIKDAMKVAGSGQYPEIVKLSDGSYTLQNQ